MQDFESFPAGQLAVERYNPRPMTDEERKSVNEFYWSQLEDCPQPENPVPTRTESL